MPREPIDYSKAQIYKLCCRDPEITEIYIGSTTNMVQRLARHRSRGQNPAGPNYNLRVYQFIRQNGGFDNWTMLLIEDYPCNSSQQLARREGELIQSLNAKLNSQIAGRTKAEYTRESLIKHPCTCGAMYSNHHKLRHQRTIRHNINSYLGNYEDADASDY